MLSQSATNRRRFSHAERKKLNRQKVIASSVEIMRLLDFSNERWSSQEIIDFLNKLCTTVSHVEKLPDHFNLYDSVCKRIARYVLSDISSVRAITYRILRKAFQSPDNLLILFRLHIDVFAIRSLELNINSGEERTEALKLCALMLKQNSALENVNFGQIKEDFTKTSFPMNICRTMIAVANTLLPALPGKPKVNEDELAFSCLVTVAEQAVVTPDLIINSIGVGWITEYLTCSVLSDHLSTCICRILCAWIDSPRLRMQAKLQLVLERIFAPVIEIGLFQRRKTVELNQQLLPVDALQLENFLRIFLTLLRTWSGLFACLAIDCQQEISIMSPLRFLSYVVLSQNASLNKYTVCDLIIGCCCEILELPYSKIKFLDWLETARYYSAVHYPDAYKSSLSDEFVLAEHDMLLKIRDQQQTNVIDLLVPFHALIVYFLINTDLVQILSRIVLQDPDDPLALKATLLMNDLLLAGSTYLPIDWKFRVLSVPALMHSACEAVNESLFTKARPFYEINDVDDGIFTYANTKNANILLHRLDILHGIILAQKTQLVPITNLQLFVPSSPDGVRSKKSILSRIIATEDAETIFNKLLIKTVDSDGSLCWTAVDTLLQFLEFCHTTTDVFIECSKKCHNIFRMVFIFMNPTKSLLVTKFGGDRFVIACCCRAIHVSLQYVARDEQYRELITNFVADFTANMSVDMPLSGTLSLKNLLNAGAMYYFAFVGAVSAHDEGRRILEASSLLQLFTDLIKGTTVLEYIKLIVSCLDYSFENSRSRVVLQTALTCSIEDGRKWTTRFLGVLASHEIKNFGEWGMRFLLGQLADPSAKVVRHALRLLHNWLPKYAESIRLLKDIRFETFGDAGTLLKAHLFADENHVKNNISDSLTTMNYWKKIFCARYVELIDEDVKVALLNTKRSIDGRFARPSNERSAKFGVPMPVHLYGQLSRHEIGRELLLRTGEIDRLLDVLRDSPLPEKAYEICELKGALYALGHCIAVMDPNILPVEAVPIICRFAECCPVLSIRGTALWILNLIGSTQHGSIRLSALGWESSKYVIDKTKLDMLMGTSSFKDVSKIWIRCIDGEKCIKQGTDFMDKELVKTTHSSTLEIDKQQAVLISKTVDVMNNLPCSSGHTTGFATTVNLGFTPQDEIDCRKLCLKKPNWSVRFHRNLKCAILGHCSCLVHCPGINTLEIKSERVQNRLTFRSLFRLPPYELDNVLTVGRCCGDPISYHYMLQDEFTYYRRFRNFLMKGGQRKNLRKREKATDDILQIIAPSKQSVILPSHPNLFSKDIFGSEEFVDNKPFSCDIRKHRAVNCLYCSWPEEYFGIKGAGEAVLPSEVRNEVLALFELEGSKHSVSSELLKKCRINRKIFASVCLYSDVVTLLAQYNYNLETRRLVQEVFADALRKFC